jgi:CIC family chloride channel protein
MMETDYNPIPPEMSIEAFVKVLAVSSHNTFPVVGNEGEFLGIVVFSKVKELVLNPPKGEHLTMFQLMSKPKATIQVDENPQSIIDKFERTLSFRLPVLDGKRYLGFITKGVLLGEYRKEILGEK